MTEVWIAVFVIIALVMALTAGLLFARSRLFSADVVDVRINDTRHVGGQRGEKLLSALHNAGIYVPAACGGKGTCGLCRVKILGDGAGEPLATERGILSAKERRSHVRLACQTSLRSDCAVEVPEEILTAGEGFECQVASSRMLAPLIREIVLTLPQDQLMDFQAGDFMQITAPAFQLALADVEVQREFEDTWSRSGWREMSVMSDDKVTRAYSLANRPEDNQTAVFNIRLAVPPAGRENDLPPGIVSTWLFSLKPGDSVRTSGPFGDFHVQQTKKDMIFVGGGVGMAPLRAMIHQQLKLGTKRKIRYFYGARTAADLFYASEFDQLSERFPNFLWTPALSDPAPGDRWNGATGFIHEILFKQMSDHAQPEECEYYLCGPPVMISAVLATLERLGVERSSIYYDDFGA